MKHGQLTGVKNHRFSWEHKLKAFEIGVILLQSMCNKIVQVIVYNLNYFSSV